MCGGHFRAKDGSTRLVDSFIHINCYWVLVQRVARFPDVVGFNMELESFILDGSEQDSLLPVINLGGLFDYPITAGGIRKPGSDVLAALLAIQDVNHNHVIKGFQLRMIFNDSKCDPGDGADAFYHLMYEQPRVEMLVGTSCSDVAETLAEIAPYWRLMLKSRYCGMSKWIVDFCLEVGGLLVGYNRTQHVETIIYNMVGLGSGEGGEREKLSHAATSPALSDREKYPTFYRLTPTDTSHHATRLAFLGHFNWDTVAILHEDTPMFSLFANELSKSFDNAGVEVKATLTFRTSVKGDLKVTLEELKKSDARVIMGSFSEEAAKEVLCEAFHLGMYAPRYVWMLTAEYQPSWWRLPLPSNQRGVFCTSAEMDQSVNGSFSVGTRADIYSTAAPPHGIASKRDLMRRLPGNIDETDNRIPMAYDTIWTSALILNQTMSALQSEEYDEKTHYKIMAEAMSTMEFTGITGPIRFNGANRQGISVLTQIQGKEECWGLRGSVPCGKRADYGRPILVGSLHPENNTMDTECSFCGPVIWEGGRIPADKYTRVHLQVVVDFTIFMVICSLGSLGIILASSLLAFNLYNRKLKLIKMSSPRLNNVAIVGCQTVYSAVIILGVENSWLPEKAYLPFCSVRAWLFAVGFSLAFGSMFAKTFRIHRLFRRTHSGLVKKRLLRDTQLLLLVGALVLLDTVLLSKDEPDTIFLPEISECYSPHMMWWGGTLCAYKGLMLVFGVYMAWETRNVQVPALNDSKYIGMNIYNVVLCSITAVSLAVLLKDRPSLSYAMVASLIMLSTTLLLLFLFMPKIYALAKRKDDLVVTSAGLVTKASTRRFSSPEADKQEEKRRAQIQNRVHKHQLFEINQEIERLERMLRMAESMSLEDSVAILVKSFDLQNNSTPASRRRGICYGTPIEKPDAERSVTFQTEDDVESTDMTAVCDDLSSLDLNDRDQHCDSRRPDVKKIKEPEVGNDVIESSVKLVEGFICGVPDLNSVKLSGDNDMDTAAIEDKRRRAYISRQLDKIREEIVSLGGVEIETSDV
ncbi:hypothetical protein CAPTEDRAFT_204050 [Capitella teleta]|uniref:Gamma-aminobutyric acid type B receptor subunit 2 n=1 Tax=Capitella teleta TaxID=283909 RepID=R7V4X8_CAPTE|nr:hypothetical protein CAPTEDRAFT_204050 [Capitella teleta]|eukprot:ELU13609.1 hypothetical protein CAPTEDRAFT_204050 [Capitella teleta]